MTYTTTERLTEVENELSRIVITDGQVRYRMNDGRLVGLGASVEARARHIMSMRTKLRDTLREETGSDEAADHIQRIALLTQCIARVNGGA